jgi:magnesium transporter
MFDAVLTRRYNIAVKYLTQILGKRLCGPDGKPVGKISDAIATLGGRLPGVMAFAVRTASEELFVPYGDLHFESDRVGPKGSGKIVGDVTLRRPVSELKLYSPGDGDIRLSRDVLDRQIVDVQDRRVVRVNDVRLAEYGDTYCVVGVDASARALLRRFGGISKPIEAAAKAFGKPLRSNLIAWDDVQTLDPGTAAPMVRLKVTHDKLARLHPADIADIVEQLSPQEGAEVIENLDMESAADVMAEAETETQIAILRHLDQEMQADILDEMEPDEAADVLEALPDDVSDALLEQMDPEAAEDVEELLSYDHDTAGGLMTTELVSISADMTCDNTINRLRELSPKAETIYYVYVVDTDERLVGVLSLRDLVIAPPQTVVSDIMVKNVIHVYVDDHADQVAQVLRRYNLLAVPVVSGDEKLVGIITVDDTLERLLPPEKRRKLPIPALVSLDDA